MLAIHFFLNWSKSFSVPTHFGACRPLQLPVVIETHTQIETSKDRPNN